VALAQKMIAYWRARMDRLRVGDVAAELGKLSELALGRAGRLERAERAARLPDGYAKEAFGMLARHERLLAARLKALEEKLGWCFQQ
jgi:hypothetical protein